MRSATRMAATGSRCPNTPPRENAPQKPQGTVRLAGCRLGFTLVEVLVALAVFAIIGVMAARILAGMVDISEFTQQRGQVLAATQRAFAIIERDIEQLAHRPVRDEMGDPTAAVTVGGVTLAEFTRAGWQNPLGYPRPELQRVAYVVEDDTLVRKFWPVLDRAPDTEPVAQTLLTGVAAATFVARDSDGGEHSYWPAGAAGGELVAMGLRLRLEEHGEIERLWLTPMAVDLAPEGAEQPPDGGSA